MTTKYLLSLGLAAALLTGCGKKDDAVTPAADPATPAQATAQLAATQGHTATGTLTLKDEGDVLRISGTIQGLPPSAEFGFHIHEKGDCSAPDASSAGGHFNPSNAEHGNPQREAHHAGDMLNAKSDTSGVAQVDIVSTSASLTAGAPNDVRGKAIVLHEKPDDYATQPSGNSGARIACGVIN